MLKLKIDQKNLENQMTKIKRPCGNCTGCQRDKCEICTYCKDKKKKKNLFKEFAKIKLTKKFLKTQGQKSKEKVMKVLANVKLHQMVKFFLVELVTTALKISAMNAHHVKT